MFLFNRRGYWQELIASIVWVHNKLKVVPATQSRALIIVQATKQGRAVGVILFFLLPTIASVKIGCFLLVS